MGNFLAKIMSVLMCAVIFASATGVALCVHNDGHLHLVQSKIHQNVGKIGQTTEFASHERVCCVDIFAVIDDQMAPTSHNYELPPLRESFLSEFLDAIKSPKFYVIEKPSNLYVPPEECGIGNIDRNTVSRLLI